MQLNHGFHGWHGYEFEPHFQSAPWVMKVHQMVLPERSIFPVLIRGIREIRG